MEATRSRAPMMRVPVCREAHPQQFGRATIFAKKITNFLKASLQLYSRCLFLSLLVSAGVFGEQRLYEGLPDEQAQYIDFPIEGETPCTTGPVVNIDWYVTR